MQDPDEIQNILNNTKNIPQFGGGPGRNPAYPYGVAYPPAGYSNNVQLGLLTEHMLRVFIISVNVEKIHECRYTKEIVKNLQLLAFRLRLRLLKRN